MAFDVTRGHGGRTQSRRATCGTVDRGARPGATNQQSLPTRSGTACVGRTAARRARTRASAARLGGALAPLLRKASTCPRATAHQQLLVFQDPSVDACVQRWRDAAPAEVAGSSAGGSRRHADGRADAVAHPDSFSILSATPTSRRRSAYERVRVAAPWQKKDVSVREPTASSRTLGARAVALRSRRGEGRASRRTGRRRVPVAACARSRTCSRCTQPFCWLVAIRARALFFVMSYRVHAKVDLAHRRRRPRRARSRCRRRRRRVTASSRSPAAPAPAAGRPTLAPARAARSSTEAPERGDACAMFGVARVVVGRRVAWRSRARRSRSPSSAARRPRQPCSRCSSPRRPGARGGASRGRGGRRARRAAGLPNRLLRPHRPERCASW